MPAPTEESGDGSRLVRAIDTRALAFNAVNLTIGTTVYVVPALIAAEVGRAAILSYLACAALMGLVVLCFAEAGSRVATSGGGYAWAHRAFGPFVAFLLGWVLYIGGLVLGAASVLQLFFRGAGALLPWVNDPAPHAVLVVGILALMAGLNVRGVRRSARLVEVVTVVKLLPLAIILLTGVGGIVLANLTIDHVPTLPQFGHSIFLVIFLFAGIENALLASGEVRNPARSVPRAVVVALGVVTLLYLSTHLVAQGVMGDALANGSATPIADMAARRIGSAGRGLVLFAMIAAPLSYLLGEMLAAPRILFAMAESGILPKGIAAVHGRYRTPYVAIWLHATLIGAFVLTQSFEWLAVVSSVATLLAYLVCALSTIQLRRMKVAEVGAPFELPGGIVIPVLASVTMTALLFAVRPNELRAIVLLIGAGSLLYAFAYTRNRRNLSSAGESPVE
jgi:amino acid transporter